MSDYATRISIADYVESVIQQGIQDYLGAHASNVEVLVMYPLLLLEEGYAKNPESSSNYIARYLTSWLFTRTFLTQQQKMKTPKELSLEGYQTFRDEIHPALECMFQDYRTLQEIRDGNSYAKTMIEVNGREVRLVTSLVSNEYNSEAIYYLGIHDPDEAENEVSSKLEGLRKVTMTLSMAKPGADKRLDIDIDREMYDFCKQSVGQDLSKLGARTRSQIIRNVQDCGKVLGFLYYLAMTNRLRLSLRKKPTLIDKLMIYDKTWLINKIVKVTGLDEGYVVTLIDFLTFKGKGSLGEFPLLEVGPSIITIPALIQLNDFHFSIPNGHYVLGYDFKRRDKTISQTITNSIETKAGDCRNILCVKERAYSYNSHSQDINGEIDVALYDIDSHTLLVIECKWKDNHFIADLGDDNPIKIQDTLNKAYGEQMTRHQGFLNSPNIVADLFNEPRLASMSMPDICYIAVDKRYQLHLGDRHLLTIYVLLFLMDKYLTDGTLDLVAMVAKIRSLSTNVEHIRFDEKIFEMADGVSLVTGDLHLQYTSISNMKLK